MKIITLFTIIILFFISNYCIGETKVEKIQESLNSDNMLEEKKTYINNNQYSFVDSDFNNQIDQVVRTIFQDSKGTLWFGTEKGAFKLDKDSLIYIDGIKSEIGKGVTIKGIAEDKDGIIWFGHTDGVSSIDGKIASNYYESDGLISNDVWCIETDVNGNVWIGTNKGACIFDGKNFTNFDLPKGEIDTTLGVSSKEMIHSIFEDSKKILWFCTNAGLFSFANDSLTNISKKAGMQTNFVNKIFEDKNGELWVSTKVGLYKLTANKAENITKGKIETGKGIGSISEDKFGKLWFVANQHFLFTYDRENLIEYQKTEDNKGPVVFQIFKDQENRLWFVGFGGAYRFENGNFININKNGPW